MKRLIFFNFPFLFLMIWLMSCSSYHECPSIGITRNDYQIKQKSAFTSSTKTKKNNGEMKSAFSSSTKVEKNNSASGSPFSSSSGQKKNSSESRSPFSYTPQPKFIKTPEKGLFPKKIWQSR